jgi:hypothetical protein
LVRKPEGKRPVGRQKHRLEDNIKKGSKRNRILVVWTEFLWLRTGTGGGLL